MYIYSRICFTKMAHIIYWYQNKNLNYFQIVLRHILMVSREMSTLYKLARRPLSEEEWLIKGSDSRFTGLFVLYSLYISSEAYNCRSVSIVIVIIHRV